ncbi:collagen alpha-1(I) chain-like [Haemorhous mexicanus]|uniref:collagen alpha-1(I) chain-like n=1 Tax=Haemorhous mexicanus TaxID=30427 RepID=UPI0028BF15B4|nr:collagen alpha-1(I) chain-like [Haemorhous mexicanus]
MPRRATGERGRRAAAGPRSPWATGPGSGPGWRAERVRPCGAAPGQPRPAPPRGSAGPARRQGRARPVRRQRGAGRAGAAPGATWRPRCRPGEQVGAGEGSRGAGRHGAGNAGLRGAGAPAARSAEPQRGTGSPRAQGRAGQLSSERSSRELGTRTAFAKADSGMDGRLQAWGPHPPQLQVMVSRTPARGPHPQKCGLLEELPGDSSDPGLCGSGALAAHRLPRARVLVTQPQEQYCTLGLVVLGDLIVLRVDSRPKQPPHGPRLSPRCSVRGKSCTPELSTRAGCAPKAAPCIPVRPPVRQ